MKNKLGLRILLTLIALVTIAGFVMVWYSLTNSSKTNRENGVISLEAPFFTSVAEASPAQETKTFLEKEAGISAYTNVGQVDLAEAKKVYRTVEREEDEYIVGSVALPDYDEAQDPHVYVSKDGWVVAYYLKDDPASKMMDWVSYNKTGTVSTKFEAALKLMCDQLGKLLPDVKYYDFRYPDANELMIIADKDGRFKVKIPDDITVYERSWWCLRIDGYDNPIYIDENEVVVVPSKKTYAPKGSYGKFTPIQLSQGMLHTIREEYISPFGIALVYKEP